MKDLRDFMSLTEASAIIQRTPVTLRNWADSGRIRAVRDPAGRRLLVRSDVERVARELHSTGSVGGKTSARP